jgi:hypothetical protein
MYTGRSNVTKKNALTITEGIISTEIDRLKKVNSNHKNLEILLQSRKQRFRVKQTAISHFSKTGNEFLFKGLILPLYSWAYIFFDFQVAKRHLDDRTY